jgi:hypothetical protein
MSIFPPGQWLLGRGSIDAVPVDLFKRDFLDFETFPESAALRSALLGERPD